MDIPKEALELGKLFAEAGEELNLVGGSVRDLLFGQQVNDLDFSTSASPEKTYEIMQSYLTGPDDNLWTVGIKYGTIGGSKHTVSGEDVQIEVTTYRADSYDEDSRKPTVEYGDNCLDDLKRRDFSINCIAVKLPEIEMIDPYNGVSDFATKTIKTPVDPSISFSDDPLRIMRAFRFMAKFGFEIETGTLKAIVEMKDRLEIVSAERIRDEFTKLILTDSPAAAINLMVQTGVMDFVIPELKFLNIDDPAHLHKDVYTHSLKVLEHCISLETNGPDLIQRLAGLLHDIAKPNTKKVDPETHKVSFRAHDVIGAKMAVSILKRLKFDKETISNVKQLVYQHLRAYGFKSEADWTDSAVRRFAVDAGDNLQRLLILTRSDVTSENPKKVARLYKAFDELEARIVILKEQEELKKLRPALDGRQIMKLLNIRPGRKVGEVYQFLMEIRMNEGEISETEATERVLNKFSL
jgi:poly(A) polymerase